VTSGTDGLHFDPPKPWKFDDGADLGSYNTQAHWAQHGDKLYLVYTRKGAKNDHVFRHRAPLFMAEVDRVLRQGGALIALTVSGSHYVTWITRGIGRLPDVVSRDIVKRLYDRPPDPGLDRCGIGRIVDREHRALQDVGALLGEKAGELRFLARFQDQDAVAVEPVSHGSS